MLTLPKLLDSFFLIGNAIVLNLFLNVDDKVLDTAPSDKWKNDTSIIVERTAKKKPGNHWSEQKSEQLSEN